MINWIVFFMKRSYYWFLEIKYEILNLATLRNELLRNVAPEYYLENVSFSLNWTNIIVNMFIVATPHAFIIESFYRFLLLHKNTSFQICSLTKLYIQGGIYSVTWVIYSCLFFFLLKLDSCTSSKLCILIKFL